MSCSQLSGQPCERVKLLWSLGLLQNVIRKLWNDNDLLYEESWIGVKIDGRAR